MLQHSLTMLPLPEEKNVLITKFKRMVSLYKNIEINNNFMIRSSSELDTIIILCFKDNITFLLNSIYESSYRNDNFIKII